MWEGPAELRLKTTLLPSSLCGPGPAARQPTLRLPDAHIRMTTRTPRLPRQPRPAVHAYRSALFPRVEAVEFLHWGPLTIHLMIPLPHERTSQSWWCLADPLSSSSQVSSFPNPLLVPCSNWRFNGGLIYPWDRDELGGQAGDQEWRYIDRSYT